MSSSYAPLRSDHRRGQSLLQRSALTEDNSPATHVYTAHVEGTHVEILPRAGTDHRTRDSVLQYGGRARWDVERRGRCASPRGTERDRIDVHPDALSDRPRARVVGLSPAVRRARLL